MAALEFGGALDEHLLEDAPDDVCEHCDADPCACPEPDFEQMVADRSDWLAS